MLLIALHRVDSRWEYLMILSTLALPKSSNLEQLYHIFLYLKKQQNTEIVFDPTNPIIDKEYFKNQDWINSFFAINTIDLKEALSKNMLEPRAKGLTLRAYLDADHTGGLMTRWMQTRFMIYLNSSFSYWHSKKQTSVETLTFRSKCMLCNTVGNTFKGIDSIFKWWELELTIF